MRCITCYSRREIFKLLLFIRSWVQWQVPRRLTHSKVKRSWLGDGLLFLARKTRQSVDTGCGQLEPQKFRVQSFYRTMKSPNNWVFKLQFQAGSRTRSKIKVLVLILGKKYWNKHICTSLNVRNICNMLIIRLKIPNQLNSGVTRGFFVIVIQSLKSWEEADLKKQFQLLLLS